MGSSKQMFPPNQFRLGQFTGGFLEPLRDGRRHRRVRGVVAQQLFRIRKFPGGRLLGLVFSSVLLLLFLGKFGLVFHNSASGIFYKKSGKGFAGAMQFPAHRVGGLPDQRANLLVTQFLVGHEQ